MADLPTWTFRPDWSKEVIERLEWRTEILGSITGAEQAIATRYAPRRSVEARFLCEGAERTYLSLTMQRAGSSEFLVPLWFHSARLTAPVAAAATLIPCDTVNREFRAGDHALLVGEDAFGGETVEILSVAAGSLTLLTGTVGEWPAGTRLHPLRTARFDRASLAAQTSRVGETSLRFLIDADNDVDGGAETFTLYQGLPVLTQQPNWVQALTQDFEWLRDDHDSKTGLRVIADTAGRAFVSTRYGLMLCGRAEQQAFRDLLYRLRGRQKPVWIPSHMQDMVVADAASSGATALEVGRVGLTELGGVSDDIAHLLIGSDLAVSWSDLAVPSSADREKLTLTAPLTRDVAAGEKIRLLNLSRLDQDTVTIRHETDSDGVATVALSWKAFDGSRSGVAAGDYPIAVTAMTVGGCCDAGGGGSSFVSRFPATYTVPLPGEPVGVTGVTVVGDTVAWAVGGNMQLTDNRGWLYSVKFNVGSIQQIIDGSTKPATMAFTQNIIVYDDETFTSSQTTTLTINAVRSGTIVSLDCSLSLPLVTLRVFDLGTPPVTDTKWWIRNVQGNTTGGWSTATTAPGPASSTLSNPAAGGSLVTGADNFYDLFGGREGDTGYNGYFAPYPAGSLP